MIVSLFLVIGLLPLFGLHFPEAQKVFDYQPRFLFYVQNQLWVWLGISMLAALVWWDGRNRFIKSF